MRKLDAWLDWYAECELVDAWDLFTEVTGENQRLWIIIGSSVATFLYIIILGILETLS